MCAGQFADINSLFVYNIRNQTCLKMLYKRESLIIFDEVQRYPKARELIKYLVADGRYDYLETGSLISLRMNVEDIVIPSEEEHVEMFPIEVTSGTYRMHSSLDKFRNKFKGKLGQAYILYTKDILIKENVIHLPIYMAMFL